MKKLGILVMALVLVVGMSVGVMAWAGYTPESQGDRNDIGKTKNIPIELEVAEMALINIPAGTTFDVGTLNAVNAGENNQSGDVNFTIISNCPITVTYTNNFNPSAVGLGMSDMDDYDGDDEWVLSPAAMLKSPENLWAGVGQSQSFDLDAGINDITMVYGINFGDNDDSTEDKDPNDRWRLMTPMDKQQVGNVTLTVAAQ